MKKILRSFLYTLDAHIVHIWGIVAGLSLAKYGLDWHTVLSILSGVLYEQHVVNSYVEHKVN